MKMPEEKGVLISAACYAVAINQKLHTAFWLGGRDDETAVYRLKAAHEDFAQLAAVMGYTITPIDAPVSE